MAAVSAPLNTICDVLRLDDETSSRIGLASLLLRREESKLDRIAIC